MPKSDKPRFSRIISLMLILTFLVTQAPVSVFAQTLQNRASGVTQIEIPRELGKIEEIYLAPACRIPGSQACSKKQIIFIQDAHDSIVAQENIAKIIRHLTAGKAGVQTVYEEGFEGPVPTDSFFAFIENPKIREKVSYFFLDKLRLGAAEYAHINRGRDFKLLGADSIKLHHQNIRQYQKSARFQKEIQEDLDLLLKEVNALGARYLRETVKDFLKIRQRFDKNQIDLTDYLSRIRAASNKAGFKTESDRYPFIYLILTAHETKNPDLVRQLQDMDPREFFTEIDRYENDLAAFFLKTDKERKIYSHLKELLLIKRLNELEVTPQEYESVRNTLGKVSTAKLAKWISKEIKRTVVLSRAWEESIKHALKFYAIAAERDLFCFDVAAPQYGRSF